MPVYWRFPSLATSTDQWSLVTSYSMRILGFTGFRLSVSILAWYSRCPIRNYNTGRMLLVARRTFSRPEPLGFGFHFYSLLRCVRYVILKLCIDKSPLGIAQSLAFCNRVFCGHQCCNAVFSIHLANCRSVGVLRCGIFRQQNCPWQSILDLSRKLESQLRIWNALACTMFSL